MEGIPDGNVLVISGDRRLVDALKERLEGRYQLHVGQQVADAAMSNGSTAWQGVLVHLDRRSGSGDRAATMLKHLERLSEIAPVVALIDPHCPARLRQRAHDIADACVPLPLNGEDLAAVIEGQDPMPPMLREMFNKYPFQSIRGRTRSFVTFEPRLFEMLEELQVAAVHDVTVLLTGETGAGKTHLSRLIHELSARRHERFCTVACAALSPELVESELFGHVKGAFTGAERDRDGKFAAAGRGTLLLDEIDTLTLEQQAKLLRVIETGEYEAVGSNDTQVSEARIIVASNHALEDLVEKGTFRKDLYYRLNILRFELLPLRDRPLDIEFLTRHFALRHSRQHNITLENIEDEAVDVLKRYKWPGNLRELDNVIRRAVLFCRDGVVRPGDLPSTVMRRVADEPVTLAERKDRSERQLIVESLRRHNQQRTATAKELGISRVTLYNKMKKYGLLT